MIRYFRLVFAILFALVMTFGHIQGVRAFVPAYVAWVGLTKVGEAALVVSGPKLAALGALLVGTSVTSFVLMDHASNRVEIPLARRAEVTGPPDAVDKSPVGDPYEYMVILGYGEVIATGVGTVEQGIAHATVKCNERHYDSNHSGTGCLYISQGGFIDNDMSVTFRTYRYDGVYDQISEGTEVYRVRRYVREGTCDPGYFYDPAANMCIVDFDEGRPYVADKKCDVRMGSQALLPYEDIDCPVLVVGGTLSPVFRGGDAYVYGKIDGKDAVWEVKPPRGTPSTSPWYWTVKEYVTLDDGYLQVTTALLKQSSAMAESSQVLSVYTDVIPGTVVMPEVDAIPMELADGVSVSVENAAQTATNDPNPVTTGEVSIEFPSDYSRIGEADAAANKINTKLDNIYKIESPPTDPTLPTSSQFQDVFFKDTFLGLLAWRLPAHQSACPIAEMHFNYFGQVFDLRMDAHCIIAEDHRNTLSVAMIVVWMLSGLLIVLRS
jgi:hypothetical protein